MATFPMVPQALCHVAYAPLWARLQPIPIDWDWQNAEQYLHRLPHASVNIATLVGHGNLRLCVVGDG